MQAAMMEALLHALQLCIAIPCTQHQMASHPCRQQPDKHPQMHQCCSPKEEGLHAQYSVFQVYKYFDCLLHSSVAVSSDAQNLHC